MGLDDAPQISGHSWFQKARFCLTFFAPMATSFFLAPIRDLYVLKFGADPTLIFSLYTAVLFWTPVSDLVIGYMQVYLAWY